MSNPGTLQPMVKGERERTEFGWRMYRARKAAGLTQEEAAKRAGISQASLSELETTAASTRAIMRFGAIYGIDPYLLATGETAPDQGQGIIAAAHIMPLVRSIQRLGTQADQEEAVDHCLHVIVLMRAGKIVEVREYAEPTAPSPEHPAHPRKRPTSGHGPKRKRTGGP